MIKMTAAEGEELLLASGAADRMEEFRINSLPDEVGVFFDLLDSFGVGNAGIADRPVEIMDV